jgi:hypothetical protein
MEDDCSTTVYLFIILRENVIYRSPFGLNIRRIDNVAYTTLCHAYWPGSGQRRAAVTVMIVIIAFPICKLDGNSIFTSALSIFHTIINESRAMRS